ncbi:efflux RND transporter periplasmic adaptor subunit [Pulveribacter sp.]|uniref:HlyD family secretion protein n=1 Tax=Pulveribacter sp. TaxID=2678893 RepID=UPI002896F0A9|nr:efflux RND transporter periplasmic adaptor subunit [Pulveribacter sp.]
MTAPENPRVPAKAPTPSQRPRPPWALVLAGLALLVFIAWGFWRAAQPPAPYFQGQMEARETDVAGKVTARIARVLVQEGQRIQPGALLVELDSPEVRAKMAQAEAARDAARAQADKAESGARPEEVQMARLAWQRAQAAADLAQTSWQRVEGLYAQGLVAAQKRDEAQTNARAAAAQAQAARAQYDMAARGARGEDKAAAEAQTRRAAGAVAEVEAAQAETQLRSPVGGEVAKVLAREGELSPQGVALVTVVDLQDQWLVLNVREDQLARFAKGSRFSGHLPALDGRTAEFEVYFLGVLPDFATWRATRGSQGFDARTFEVRARPAAPIDGARPGMSVIVEDRR